MRPPAAAAAAVAAGGAGVVEAGVGVVSFVFEVGVDVVAFCAAAYGWLSIDQKPSAATWKTSRLRLRLTLSAPTAADLVEPPETALSGKGRLCRVLVVRSITGDSVIASMLRLRALAPVCTHMRAIAHPGTRGALE